MKRYQILLLAAILAVSCKKDNSDSTVIVITGQFQKMVQGTNVWVETMDGVTEEVNRYIMFVPDKQEITTEEMYATPDADGKFQVTLLKGESYHVHIVYKTNPSAEGHIKFNESMGNQIIVPDDAPNSFDLGKLYVSALYPYGVGWVNEYLSENPLPWLTETIDISNNSNPVIGDVYPSVINVNDPDIDFGFQRIAYTGNVTDADDDQLYYNWFLTTSDNSASFLAWNLVTRTVNDEIWVYTKAANTHGTLTLIVTDERGGSARKDITF